MVTRLVVTLLTLSAATAATAATPLHVTPADVHLKGNFDHTQLLVTGEVPRPESADLTTDVRFRSSDPSVVTVSETGLLRAAGNGQAEITVALDNRTATARVTVEGFAQAPTVLFDEQIRPIISRLGCNAGECHASQFGKGG
ncbi:MAG: Ig domain-containing protein, partial [Maioricimonas sp. JB049]